MALKTLVGASKYSVHKIIMLRRYLKQNKLFYIIKYDKYLQLKIWADLEASSAREITIGLDKNTKLKLMLTYNLNLKFELNLFDNVKMVILVFETCCQ